MNVPYNSEFLWSQNFMIFLNYSWITKILFTKICSRNAWLVDEENSVLGTKYFTNFGKIYENFITKNYFQDKMARTMKI